MSPLFSETDTIQLANIIKLFRCSKVENPELEIRMKCNDEQMNRVLRNLHGGKWCAQCKVEYTDYLATNTRTRCQASCEPITTQKEVIQQLDLVIETPCGEGLLVRAAYSAEKTKPSKDTLKMRRQINAVRHIERHTYTHKNYIRFDLSKVVHVTSTQFTRQEQCTCQNEIEIELTGLNVQYEKSADPAMLYAQSMLMKAKDIMIMMYPNLAEPQLP